VWGEIPESQIGSAFGQGRQIHLKVIDGKFPVDVMELKLMLIQLVFSQIFRRQLFEGIQIEGTILVDAFMDVKVFAILLFNKSMSAVRA